MSSTKIDTEMYKSHILSLYRFNPGISDLNGEGTSESRQLLAKEEVVVNTEHHEIKR